MIVHVSSPSLEANTMDAKVINYKDDSRARGNIPLEFLFKVETYLLKYKK